MSKLFGNIIIRDVKINNRIFVSPMCQYSSEFGYPNNWHLVHLGSRAVGGAGLIITEATAVSPEGRISPNDLGIWSEEHSEKLKVITSFISSQGSVPGIQLAHAGRKASTKVPWKGNGLISLSEGGWVPLAPSAVRFAENYPQPKEMSLEDIQDIIQKFKEAARYSIEAGFKVIEIHAAHGYLLHEFLSPFSNIRKDKYGGSLQNRMRLPLEIIESVRNNIPSGIPLFVRISATDWKEGGWNIEESLIFSKEMKSQGVDLIDCSTGGNIPNVKIPLEPNYQVPFAETIKKQTGILTGAVGLITNAIEAEEIIASGKADAVLLARQFLRDPYWPLHAAKQLGVELDWPMQYLRAKD